MKDKFFIPVLIIILWLIVSFFRIINNFILPSPISVLTALIKMICENNFLFDIFFTLMRTTFGFILACIIGIPLGLIMGYSEAIYNIFEFTINFFRNIPATALFPLFIIFFGVGEESKIAMAFWTSFLILVVNSVGGMLASKKIRILAAELLRLNKWTIFKEIIFFEALPQIFIGIRVAYSLAFIIVIVAEMSMGTNFGLGRRIIDAQLIYKTDELYAAIIISGLLGFIINQSLLSVERKILFWQRK